jgi:hypothetical protein
MTERNPKLFADESGVWCDMHGNITGIKWNEISEINGYKIDCKTEICVVIELGFEFGEYLELYSDGENFRQLVDKISTMIPDISPYWFQAIDKSQVGDSPVIVWSRT